MNWQFGNAFRSLLAILALRAARRQNFGDPLLCRLPAAIANLPMLLPARGISHYDCRHASYFIRGT